MQSRQGPEEEFHCIREHGCREGNLVRAWKIEEVCGFSESFLLPGRFHICNILFVPFISTVAALSTENVWKSVAFGSATFSAFH